jgi:hypothetical protein
MLNLRARSNKKNAKEMPKTDLRHLAFNINPRTFDSYQVSWDDVDEDEDEDEDIVCQLLF